MLATSFHGNECMVDPEGQPAPGSLEKDAGLRTRSSRGWLTPPHVSGSIKASPPVLLCQTLPLTDQCTPQQHFSDGQASAPYKETTPHQKEDAAHQIAPQQHLYHNRTSAPNGAAHLHQTPSNTDTHLAQQQLFGDEPRAMVDKPVMYRNPFAVCHLAKPQHLLHGHTFLPHQKVCQHQSPTSMLDSPVCASALPSEQAARLHQEAQSDAAQKTSVLWNTDTGRQRMHIVGEEPGMTGGTANAGCPRTEQAAWQLMVLRNITVTLAMVQKDQEVSSIMMLLSYLLSCPITSPMLLESQIVRAIKPFKQHTHAGVATFAKLCLQKWWHLLSGVKV